MVDNMGSEKYTIDSLKVKKYGIVRNLNYLKENLIICFKSLSEYKLNLFNSIFEQLIFYFILIIFGKVLISNFGDLIGWSFIDYLLFLIIVDLSTTFTGIFVWDASVQKAIKTGSLNNFLFRPINRIIGFQFHHLNYSGLVDSIMNFIFLFIIVFYYGIVLSNILFGILIFILICFHTIAIDFFIRSLSFISFGLAQTCLDLLLLGSYDISKKFPFGFFEKMKFRFIVFIFSQFFIGSLLIPILLNKEIWNFWLQIYLLVGMFVVFFVCGVLLWRYGLKNYQAFG
ncbi:MAG: ABC-2 family transporter protein [Nanoarchaeales archaeon]|nr:ABC-2 family transporter protein [Nanoarchaeales archaeon]